MSLWHANRFRWEHQLHLMGVLTLALVVPVSARSAVIYTLVFVWDVLLCVFLLSQILAWGED